MQGALIWMLWHWIMEFVKPSPVVMGCIFLLLDMLAFHHTQEQRWQLCCAVAQEKSARLLSEGWKETLAGVVSVTFDASCECDGTGRILQSSQHLQQLLGSSTCDRVDLGLIQLAANSEEAQRVNTFLTQILGQREANGTHAVTPALLETVLTVLSDRLTSSSSAEKSGGLDCKELKVKLCCVPMPTDDGSVCNSQRLFVGLQKVPDMRTLLQSTGTRANEQVVTSSSSKEKSSGAASSENVSVSLSQNPVLRQKVLQTISKAKAKKTQRLPAHKSVSDNSSSPNEGGEFRARLLRSLEADNAPSVQAKEAPRSPPLVSRVPALAAINNIPPIFIPSQRHAEPSLQFNSALPFLAKDDVAELPKQQWEGKEHAVFEEDDLASQTSASFSYTETEISVAGADAVQAQEWQGKQHAVFEDDDLRSQSSASFSYTGTEMSVANAPVYVRFDASTQTAVTPVAEASTQTAKPSESVTIAPRLNPPSGCPPRPAIEVQVSKPAKTQKKGRSVKHHKIPRFQPPFISALRGTPVNSVEFLLHESLTMVNPAGNGCCFWHVGLMFFQDVIQQMLSRHCTAQVQPNEGWQCQFCFLLHADADDSDSDSELECCDSCGYKRALEQAQGSLAAPANAGSLADESASCGLSSSASEA